jgi:hypothetical protein
MVISRGHLAQGPSTQGLDGRQMHTYILLLESWLFSSPPVHLSIFIYRGHEILSIFEVSQISPLFLVRLVVLGSPIWIHGSPEYDRQLTCSRLSNIPVFVCLHQPESASAFVFFFFNMIFIILFLSFLKKIITIILLYWGYIVSFTKVLTIYLS